MRTRTILMVSFAALAITAGVPGVAAPAQSQPSGAGTMQQSQDSGQGQSMMQGNESGSMKGGGMMGSGMMGSGMMGMHGGGMGNDHGMRGRGMMGMMSGCPMMMGAGLDRKTAMRMHGEMMRAIGDLLIKYSDKVEPSARQ